MASRCEFTRENVRIRWRHGVLAGLLALCAGLFVALSQGSSQAAAQEKQAATREKPAAAAEKPAKDPAAMQVLERMVSYLRSLPAFGIRADITRDDVVGDGFKVQRTSQVSVHVKRPDRMRAELSGDQGERVLVYDGKQVHVLAQDEGYFGSTAAPPTLREALDAIPEEGVELPLVDVIFVAMGGELASEVVSAGDIGPSKVGGVACHQVAFRGEHADWQIWVEEGQRPVPRKLVVTTRDVPSQPQYSALMSWDLTPDLKAVSFQFTPPKGALPMALGPLGTELKAGRAQKAKSAR